MLRSSPVPLPDIADMGKGVNLIGEYILIKRKTRYNKNCQITHLHLVKLNQLLPIDTLISI